MSYWLIDVRVLVLRAPSTVIKLLIEVPKEWSLPPDGSLPGPALEAVTKALRVRFPQCPITPIRVRTADADSLKRIAERTYYSDTRCRVWLIG